MVGCQCCWVREGREVYQIESRQDQPQSSPGKRGQKIGESGTEKRKEEKGQELRFCGECRTTGKPLLINVTNIY